VCKHILTHISLILLPLISVIPVANSARLQDPTRPPGVKFSHQPGSSKAKPSWILSSTLVANGRRNAVINNRLVSVGQTINQARILSIQSNAVWLMYKQKRIQIKLLAREIKDFSKAADK